MIPFTTEQFLKVFESYNEAIYPVQWVLLTTAVAAIFLSSKPNLRAGKVIAVLLFVLWSWSGIVYHWMFFSRINSAAYLFGLLFVIQAVLFLWAGVARSDLHFRARFSLSGIAGWLLIIYAIVVYPALGYVLGHPYPQSATFGVPCPLTVFTFGLLLWVDDDQPPYLTAVPLAWSLIGTTAALVFGMWEDLGLLAGAAVATLLILRRSHHRRLHLQAG